MTERIGAVILAGGYSSRMGMLKPLMPLGGEAIITRQIKLFQLIGIKRPIVVTGFRSEEISAAAEDAGALTVYNPDYENGMYTSVAAGVRALTGSAGGGSAVSAFFLLPADIPLVTGCSLLEIIRAREISGADVAYPSFSGRRGHPPLIGAALIPGLLSHDGTGGLRRVLERHEGTAAESEMTDDAVLLDMDTPEAYADIRKRFAARQIPSTEQCMTILGEQQTPEAVLRHSEKTAELATELGKRLNGSGAGLSLPLLNAAGLLHDVARTRANHAAAGACLLRLYGFDDLADITASHMEHQHGPGDPLTETDVVYLADKLLSGTETVPLKQRRSDALKRKGTTPEIRWAINRKFDIASEIARRVEFLTGEPLPPG